MIYISTYSNISMELKTNNNILRSHNFIRVYGSDSSLVCRKQIIVIFYCGTETLIMWHLFVRTYYVWATHWFTLTDNRLLFVHTPRKRNTCIIQYLTIHTHTHTHTTLNINCCFQSPYNVIIGARSMKPL